MAIPPPPTPPPRRAAPRPAPARSRGWPAACVLLLALAAPAYAGISVDVQGVEGDLRRNVLPFLSLERYKSQSDLDAALPERLVARVPREVAAAIKPFGYYEPRVAAELASEGAGAWRLRVQVEPGEPVMLDAVDVRVTGPGAQTPAFRAIVDGKTLRVGARLEHSAYDATKGALQRTAANLGYFDSRLLHSEMQVDVAARRATPPTPARATVGWENRRLNARGHRLRAELQAAQQAQTATAPYSVPIGDPALEKLSGEFRSARVDVGDLEISVAEFEPSLSPVRGDWQRVLGTRITRTRTIVDRPPNLLFDETDVLAIPDISFSRVPREAERAFGLADAWHFVVRGRIDASLVDDAADLPGSERFFAGGDRSVRGFGYNELSPLGPTGARVGARHALVASAGVVRDLPRNLGIAAFVDAGNAFDRFGDPLRYSVGLGLRWRLPVVTIGIDVAQPLTNPDCTAARPDPRCSTTAGFDSLPGPRLHLSTSPKL